MPLSLLFLHQVQYDCVDVDAFAVNLEIAMHSAVFLQFHIHGAVFLHCQYVNVSLWCNVFYRIANGFEFKAAKRERIDLVVFRESVNAVGVDIHE